MHAALKPSANSDNQPPVVLALSSPDLSKALANVSESTIAGWVRRGLIPYVQIGGKGGRIIFPIDLIRQWLKEQAVNGTQISEELKQQHLQP